MCPCVRAACAQDTGDRKRKGLSEVVIACGLLSPASLHSNCNPLTYRNGITKLPAGRYKHAS